MRYRIRAIDREGCEILTCEKHGTVKAEMEVGRLLMLPDLFEVKVTIVEEQGEFGFTYEDRQLT